jgi:hypothetical protein
LPDGIFSNQKSLFVKILELLAIEDVGIFYDHLVYLTAIWYKYFVAVWVDYRGFGIGIFPVLLCYSKKNLATLMSTN